MTKELSVLAFSARCFGCGMLLTLLAACSDPDQSPATLVIQDARAWTGDPGRPWAEAVATAGDSIVAVGTTAEIAKLTGPDTVLIDAGGAMLLPGFIDAHVHFLDGGRTLAAVQLRDASSPEDFTKRIADFATTAEPGGWIAGGIWDHTNWGGELPSRDWIDAVTPDNPVWVLRLDGHMGLANSLALKLAGVNADTPDIDGGEIVRDAGGRPTGVLKDNAMSLVFAAMPEPTDRQLDEFLAAAMRHVAQNGVTSVHDMFDVTFDAWRALETYDRVHARNGLITRIYAATPLADWRRLEGRIIAQGRGDDWLRIGAVKGFMDGSLGSHTAAFLQPYTDAPDDSGFLLAPLDELQTLITDADAAGLQLNVHAIGDKAIRDLLDIFEAVEQANGTRDRRWRMEHAQHIHPDDMPRFAAQNVIASMQPYHAIDDGRWASDVIGAERSETTYAFNSLLASGARVAFGSDWFVAPAAPLLGIYAAVTRRTLDGKHPDGWVPGEKITVEQALRAYTLEAAYASGAEDRKGRLKPGMLADMVLIDRDLTRIEPEDIRNAVVLQTIVGGEVVYRR